MQGTAQCLSCSINVGGPADASLQEQAQQALDREFLGLAPLWNPTLTMSVPIYRGRAAMSGCWRSGWQLHCLWCRRRSPYFY